MRKEEQPIVEPVAFLVANATIPHEPVKAKGWSNEPFPAFYPADRESDAQEAARILRAVCEPLYPASALEALQAEIERLKGERDRWEKHATTGDREGTIRAEIGECILAEDAAVDAGHRGLSTARQLYVSKDDVRAILRAALSAMPSGEVKVKALDLSNLLKHAFSAGYTSAAGDNGWADYDPTQCPAYDRILSALKGQPSMSAREIIAEQCDGAYSEKRANRILASLATHGFRILGPGSLDRETIEKCAALAGEAAKERFGDGDPEGAGVIEDLAAAIRALGAEK